MTLHPTSLSPPRVLTVVAGIYITQSAIGGLTFQGIPAVLRAEGAGLDVIGLVSLLMLPWALKFLWAPALERLRLPLGRHRRSRPIILAGQLTTIALVAALALFRPGELPVLLFAAMAAAAVVTATIDIACDAFTIEQLTARNRGLGNTAQVGGGYIGMLLGGGLFLVAVDRYGWPAGTIVLAAMLLFLTLPMMLTREPAGPAVPPGRRPSLKAAFERPAVRWGLVVVLLFQVGMRLTQGLTNPFLVDRGFDLEMIGLISGGAGVALSLLGALAAGFVVRRWPPGRLLRPVLALEILLFVALAAAALWPGASDRLLVALLLAKTTVIGFSFVALYTAMMNWSSLRQAGVDFTLLQCADAAMAAVAGLSAGFIAQHLGYATCFALAAVLALAAVSLLPAVTRRAGTEAADPESYRREPQAEAEEAAKP